MKFFIKILILITVILFSNETFAISKNNSEFGIVAKVNNEAITKYDFNNRYKLVRMSLREKGIRSNKNIIRKQALEQLIEDKIKEQEVLKKKIVVEDSVVKNYISELEQKLKISRGGLKRRVRNNGINYNVYFKKMKNDLSWAKLIELNIRSNIVVLDYEVNEAVEYIIKDSNRTRFNISEIFIPISERENRNDVKEVVENLVKEIRENNNFEEIVNKFSRSSTAKNLGNIGWLDEKDLSKNIFNQIKDLKKGGVSEPLFVGDNTDGGYFIFKLNNKKKERIAKDNEVSRVKEVLYKQKLNIAIKKYLDKLNKDSFVEVYEDNL